MSLEKPWMKPFDALLVELLAAWGGTITGPGAEGARDYFFYPTYSTQRADLEVQIRISESPNGQMGYLEAGDNVEYLVVNVTVDTPLSLRVSPEGIDKKLHKLLGLVSEYQTGNKAFDKRYFLHTKTEADERAISDTPVQESIAALEPFALIEAAEKRVTVSRMIKGKADLAAKSVMRLVENTLRLAELARDRI